MVIYLQEGQKLVHSVNRGQRTNIHSLLLEFLNLVVEQIYILAYDE